MFTHFIPDGALAGLAGLNERLAKFHADVHLQPALHDLDQRFRQMDELGGHAQVIMASNPPLEDMTTPEQGALAARMLNDALAEVVAGHPDRFPAFAASLAMHNVDASVAEIHRAIGDLGARGVQIYTNAGGLPLDDARFRPVFDAIAERGLPIWLHPARTFETKDYEGEQFARHATWASLGWPYATSVAMVRMAATGMFDRYPGMNVITHHMGGMIPFFAERTAIGFSHATRGTPDENHMEGRKKLKRPFDEYLRMFHGDTAIGDSVAAIRCGLEYFGSEHVVFATDSPFGKPMACAGVLDKLDLNEDALANICRRNAEKLLRMRFD
jgi:aminocarboxymuconate-semialdehyde decarboxylase